MADQAHIDLPRIDGVAAVATTQPACRFIFRGSGEATARAFGVALPLEPCRANREGDRAALWLGPDEWLLLAPSDAQPGIAAGIAEALAGVPHALVGVSDRNQGLRLDGPASQDVLAAGCPLDLDASAFPVGMCTRTLFGKAEVVLWRTAPHTFHIEVTRSFLPYVAGLLRVAIRDAVALAHQAPAHPSL